MFFEGYTEKLWGRHPREISADWGSQRVKGLSITELVKNMLSKIGPVKEKEVETSLIESFLYPKYGPGQLWEHVADEVAEMGGRIRFGSSVQGVTVQNGKVTEIQCRNAEGQNISVAGDIFISSMPVKDLIAGMGDSAPENVHRIANGLPYRDFVTVGILTDKLNLKNETAIKTFNDQVPDCWIYVEKIFALEACWRDMSPDERQKHRMAEMKPVMDAYWDFLSSFSSEKDSNLQKAQTYSLHQRKQLEAVLLDGRLELTNNVAERSVKPFVMARRNFLFCDTAKGADASAQCFSMIETAKRNKLDPFGYLLFLLQELPKPGSEPTREQLLPLLPWSTALPEYCHLS